MIATVAKFFSILSPTRITGPIFDKELRVSSRRKRTYLLRFLYLLGLAVFIGIVWVEQISYAIDYFYSASYTEQMAAAGKMIIMYISWFQFFAMPVLAVILLSSSISSEIHSKTIGVLVSTPITSFQIVMGKMFSKIYQLLLLMAISVPILSIVRVFGGVEWNYIISTFCVTLALTIFAASLSLFMSIYIKRSFVVIPVVLIFLAASILILMWLKEFIFDMRSYSYNYRVFLIRFFACINPFEFMKINSMQLYQMRGIFAITGFVWQLHCGISLLFSMLILFLASLKVRKVALMEVNGQLSPLKRWLNTESKKQTSKTAKPKKEKPIRSISDNPVIWREARSPVFVKRKFLRIAAILIVSIGSVTAFFAGIFIALLNGSYFLQNYIVGFMIYAGLFTVIFPASCIPAEKESRSWVMLMSTSLTDRQILTGKFIGILRKCMLPWSLLLLFLVYIIVLQLTHPITLVFITLNMVSVIALLSGSGLFFGTLFRKANAAVIANIFFAVGIWLLIPILRLFFGMFGNDLRYMVVSINPFYQAAIVMDLRNFRTGFTALEYRWPMEMLGPVMTLLTITIATIIHTSAGAFFVFCAKKRLRKNIFLK